jgi:hypothetical protein
MSPRVMVICIGMGCTSKVDKAIVSRSSQGLELIIGIFEGKSKVRHSGGK